MPDALPYETPRPPSLRQKVMAGGAFLLMRQGLGMLISGVCLLLITRIIGAREFGIFVAANTIHVYLRNVGVLGIDVFLLRGNEVEQDDFDVSATLLLILGVLFGGGAIALLPWITQWVGIAGVQTIALVQFAVLPISLLACVPRAFIERELDYKKVAMIEVFTMLIFLPVALICAWQGLGAWAMVWGFITQQVLACVLLFWSSGYRYHPKWNSKRVNYILKFGSTYCLANWIWQAKSLVNPLIVGRFLGAEAVACVALCNRVTFMLSFVKRTTWRLSIATMRHFLDDKPRMKRAVTQGMELQTLSLAPVLAVAGLAMPLVIHYFYGNNWEPVLTLFPFIALATLVNAATTMHTSALHAAQKNLQVGAANFAHVTLFAVATALLVPQYGIIGVAIAEMVALVSYGLIHYFYSKEFAALDYQLTIIWCAAFGLVPFWHMIGWPSLIGVALLMIWPQTWRVLNGYLKTILSARGAKARAVA